MPLLPYLYLIFSPSNVVIARCRLCPQDDAAGGRGSGSPGGHLQHRAARPCRRPAHTRHLPWSVSTTLQYIIIFIHFPTFCKTETLSNLKQFEWGYCSDFQVESPAGETHTEPSSIEAEFLDEIQTKVLRVFLFVIHSYLYSFALIEISNSSTHATVTVHGKGQRRKT
jgi:hypothetical protein